MRIVGEELRFYGFFKDGSIQFVADNGEEIERLKEGFSECGEDALITPPYRIYYLRAKVTHAEQTDDVGAPVPEVVRGLIQEAQSIMNRSAEDEHLDTGDALDILRRLAALEP